MRRERPADRALAHSLRAPRGTQCRSWFFTSQLFCLYRIEDLMTVLKRCSLFFAAASLLFMLGCASTSKQESTGELLDDSVITSKVKAAIFSEPSLKVLQINVETTKNVVQLSGVVSTKAEMDKAVEVTRSVGGVRSVRNDLHLK
jgi:hypothetical protein